MRIERIELQNWMSYPRRWVPPDGRSGGEEVVPAIDLSAQPLTLIAGDNGAGKSAILEAICYALFAKYPRGNNQDAIRSNETTAKIRMYFVLPSAKGDVTYCVERSLSKKAGETSATLKQVQDDGSEVVLLTGQSSVTNYIEERLLRGVKYDAFVSTVFLRQEEAGRFMRLTHAQQREQLLRLCRLEIYKQIYQCAQRHRKDLDRQIAQLNEQFEQVRYATGEHLSDRQRYAQVLQGRRDDLRDKEGAAKQLLGKIERAARLAEEIRERESNLAQWSDILGRAEEIRYAELWRIAWERIEGRLTQARKLSESLARRVGEIAQAESHLEISKVAVGRRAQEYGSLQAGCEKSTTALNQVRDVLPALVRMNDSAERALEAAKEARRLDEEILRTEKEQAGREAQLAKFDELQRKNRYNNLLRQSTDALQYVLERLGDVEIARQSAEAKIVEADRASRQSASDQRSAEAKALELEELTKNAEALREERKRLQRSRDGYRDVIRNRNRAIEAGMCPTCGTEITGDIGVQVCREVEECQAHIAVLDEQLQGIEHELASAESQVARLTVDVNTYQAQARALETQAELARAAASEAEQSAALCHRQAAERWEQHLKLWREVPPPGWLRTPSVEVQEKIREELTHLTGIDSEYQRLTQVQARFQAEAEALQRARQRREEVPVESPVTCEQLARLQAAFGESADKLNSAQERRDRLAQKVEALERRRDEAERELNAAKQRLDKVDKTLSSLRTLQKSEEQYLVGIVEALQSEQGRLESQFPNLAGDLIPAVESSETYGSLKARAAKYTEEARLLVELEQVETDSTMMEAEIEVKRQESDRLRKQIGSVSETEASRRVDELQASVSSVEQELNQVNREIGNIQRDHEQRQGLELRSLEARGDHWAYRAIEDVIYPGTKTKRAGELFAHITQKLMQSISREASRILEDLGWHIEIGYEEQDGFSITDQALSAVRRFVEFSGGERFAIAVAVALAIGRVTHGAGNIRCLFIDEGFGALDQGHRKQIISDAIGKLIEIGSRDQVVVITHLKDMQAHFPHRVELKREGDHSALVSPTEELFE